MTRQIVQRLLESGEPSVRFKVRVHVLGESLRSKSIRALREEIRRSPRVRQMLKHRDKQGRIEPVRHVYRKWLGAHWILPALADIGYPPGDRDLLPVRDQVFECWLGEWTTHDVVCGSDRDLRRCRGVPIINGRARRCGSQQGNALYAALALGLADDRIHQLAECLMRWQWPDGGWNCDRDPDAHISSFHETILPLRSLSLYARTTGSAKAARAAKQAAEVFLIRRLFKRRRDDHVMNSEFVRLHYPCYWHYDILMGLKVMAEAGFIGDPRCSDALDRLERKQLAAGGWAADAKYYRPTTAQGSGSDPVSWGPVGKTRMNEWITADALQVLKAAGRF
jgi:hypothetical protein